MKGMPRLLLLRHRHRHRSDSATNVASQPAWPYPPQPHQVLEHAWSIHSGKYMWSYVQSTRRV